MSDRLAPPVYFEEARQEAAADWEDLEGHPHRAGPWWQLFWQIQNPRHVLSELLQNADDAGATWAGAEVQNRVFRFEHNGHDFNAEEFQSLCRFAFSSKRHLLTIGFRGIGFKSVFSLGSRVDLLTPTLAVRFVRDRFTEPRWLTDVPAREHTVIEVPLNGSQPEEAISSELGRWSANPLPLLFFRNIRTVQFGTDKISCREVSRGPLEGVARFRFSSDDSDLLVLKSERATFPPECVEEIREERGDPSLELPPVEVMVVVGSLQPRLHVVLPTDVDMPLGFSIQAPLLQDPARERIKEPSLSPTNRWLLRRAGDLVGRIIVEWVDRKSLSEKDKAEAYRLLPEPLDEATGLSGKCAEIVLEGFNGATSGAPVLLTTEGTAAHKDETAMVPAPLLHVWETATVLRMFAPGHSHCLSSEVDEKARRSLLHWAFADEIPPVDILTTLEERSPPRPDSIRRLAALWLWAHPIVEDNRWHFRGWWERAKVVPVEGSAFLESSRTAIPSIRRPAGCTDQDWSFLTARLSVIDSEWLTFVRKLSNASVDTSNLSEEVGLTVADEQVAPALDEALQYTGLAGEVQVGTIVRKVVTGAFAMGVPQDEGAALEVVRVAARLKVPLRSESDSPVHFKCLDGEWRSVEEGLLVEDHLDLGLLLPATYRSRKVISEEYERGLSDRQIPDFRSWLVDENGGSLSYFVTPGEMNKSFFSKASLEGFLGRRGVQGPGAYPHKTDSFTIKDWDWPQELWDHWKDRCEETEGVWVELGGAVLAAWSPSWSNRLTAAVFSHTVRLDLREIPALWRHKLSSRPCILDAYRVPRLPSELLRETRASRAFVGVEDFVYPELDNEDNAEALDALGVRADAAQPERILRRLQALSQATDPPQIVHLSRLYEALHHVLVFLDTEERANLVERLLNLPMVLTQEDGWQPGKLVARENPQNIPGVAVIHSELSDLSLWAEVDVPAMPSSDLVLRWIASLPCGEGLGPDVRNRLTRSLRGFPSDIWSKLGRWMALSGEMLNVREFEFGCRSHRVAHRLLANKRRVTADLTVLSEEEFGKIEEVVPPLVDVLFSKQIVDVNVVEWDLSAAHGATLIGNLLLRARAGDDDRSIQKEDRIVAKNLTETIWIRADNITTQIFINGEPVSDKGKENAVWQDSHLYLHGDYAKIFKDISREITSRFTSDQAKAVVDTCLFRSEEFIRSYVDSHLDIGEEFNCEASGAGAKEDDEQGGRENEYIHLSLRDGEIDAGDALDDSEEVKSEQPEESEAQEEQDAARPSQSMRRSFFKKWLSSNYEWDDERSGWRRRGGEAVLRKAGKSLPVWEYESPGLTAEVWFANRSLESDGGIVMPAEIWEAGKRDTSMFVAVPEEGVYAWYTFDELRRLPGFQVNIAEYRITCRTDDGNTNDR